LRAAAIDALDGIVLADGVTELLVSSLSAGEPPEVRRAAAYVLGGRGSLPFISPSPTEPAWAARFEFAGLLQTLAGSDPDVTVRLTASESPLVAMETEEVVTYGTPCHMSVDILTDDGPSFVVRRPDEGASARCYPLPGVEPDPEESPRVAAGKIGQREDRFDDGVESWLLLDFDLQTCWLRETQVERIDPLTDPLPAGSVAPGSTYRRGGWDVDLPLELANTPWFAHLETAGIVKRFDRGRTVTGVAVTQPLSPSQRTALLTQDEWASTPLEAILRLAIKQ
jgi:hypothetical protein